LSEHAPFRELIEPYALGALEDQERASLEAHLAGGCPECAKALDEARVLVSQLAYLAASTEPPAQLKGRLMKHVRREASAAERMRTASRNIPRWLWAGVAALLLFTFYSAWNSRRLSDEIKRINSELAAEQQLNRQRLRELAMAQREARILTDPQSKKIMLPAKDTNMPQLEAMWHPELGLCLMGHKVPMPGENRVFQLWLIPKKAGGKPMPLETLWPEADGKVMRVVENLPEPMEDTKALAITEEPAGGSPQPTGTPMWVGAVG
jgi:anti-sigma-K factor RskA